MNTNVFNRDDYVLKILPISKEDDKNSCFKLLTSSNRHIIVCQNQYSDDKYINSVIKSSNYFIYYHPKNNINEILCFSLVKINKKICDILLLCAMQNTKQYGRMIAYSVQGFAISKKCDKLYVAPRTEALRNTFIKYGFEHLRGIRSYDEVLVHHIHLPKYTITPKTLRRKRISNKYKNIILYNSNKLNNTVENIKYNNVLKII
jgi:hypothetical protein